MMFLLVAVVDQNVTVAVHDVAVAGLLLLLFCSYFPSSCWCCEDVVFGLWCFVVDLVRNGCVVVDVIIIVLLVAVVLLLLLSCCCRCGRCYCCWLLLDLFASLITSLFACLFIF